MRIRDPQRWQERFWTKVNKTDGCWLWTAGQDDKGYGQFSFRSRNIRSHRAAWMIVHGELPATDIVVCHHCDTPLCVRPDHLFIGTRVDNNLDRDKKGRTNGPRGEANSGAKLTHEDVAVVRALAGTLPTIEIAERFGVSRTTVNRIISGARWAQLSTTT